MVMNHRGLTVFFTVNLFMLSVSNNREQDFTTFIAATLVAGRFWRQPIKKCSKLEQNKIIYFLNLKLVM